MRQIRMVDLLEDKTFHAFYGREPKLLSGWMPAPPWQLLIQRTERGGWTRKIYSDFEQGLDDFEGLVEIVWDVTLGCRREEVAPPLLKIRTGRGIKRKRWNRLPEGHHWCGFCRRPTLFLRYRSHHTFSGTHMNGNLQPVRRCLVCGIPLSSVKQKWPVMSGR